MAVEALDLAWTRDIPSVSPVDRLVLGWHRAAAPEEVRLAHHWLRRMAGEWSGAPVRDRLRLLRRLRRALGDRSEALAAVLAREIGRPVVEAYGGEILPTLKALAWLERHAERALRPRVLSRFPRRVVEWQPHGVVGLLSPWNYPLFLSVTGIAWALAAGNTVLWKPSDLALETSALIGEALHAAGLEAVVKLVPGGDATGEAVVEAGCDKYVLIGSAETGRAVLGLLGEALRPAVAELSGIDPMLVLPDADLETAARSAVWARMTGAGQTCMAPKRVYVDAGVYDRFLRIAAEEVDRLRVGDPLDSRTEVGPLRTEALRQEAVSAIEEAVRLKARLITGGDMVPGRGCYLRPALLAGCDERMRVFREDLLAPVLAVSPFRTTEEAVTRANSAPGVLTASVWSRREGRPVAKRLHAGVVSVNDVMLPGAEPGVPFGGAGGSGYGRMRGAEGLREMVRPRVLDDGPPRALPRMHLFPYRAGTLEILRASAETEAADGWAGRVRGLRKLWSAARDYREERGR